MADLHLYSAILRARRGSGGSRKHGAGPDRRQNGRVANELCHTERRVNADKPGPHYVTAIGRIKTGRWAASNPMLCSIAGRPGPEPATDFDCGGGRCSSFFPERGALTVADRR